MPGTWCNNFLKGYNHFLGSTSSSLGDTLPFVGLEQMQKVISWFWFLFVAVSAICCPKPRLCWLNTQFHLQIPGSCWSNERVCCNQNMFFVDRRILIQCFASKTKFLLNPHFSPFQSLETHQWIAHCQGWHIFVCVGLERP